MRTKLAVVRNGQIEQVGEGKPFPAGQGSFIGFRPTKGRFWRLSIAANGPEPRTIQLRDVTLMETRSPAAAASRRR